MCYVLGLFPPFLLPVFHEFTTVLVVPKLSGFSLKSKQCTVFSTSIIHRQRHSIQTKSKFTVTRIIQTKIILLPLTVWALEYKKDDVGLDPKNRKMLKTHSSLRHRIFYRGDSIDQNNEENVLSLVSMPNIYDFFIYVAKTRKNLSFKTKMKATISIQWS